MLILNGKRYEKSFRQVVEQAISGILPKENALKLLESRYKYFQECISTNEQKPWFDIQYEEGKSRRTDSGEYEDDTGQYKPLIELHERQKKELAREYNSYRSEIAALEYANGEKQENIVNNGTNENPEATDIKPVPPDYIQGMIDEGILLFDGIRVARSLNKVAEYIKDEGKLEKITAKYLSQFRKANGSTYSSSAIGKAVGYVKDT